MGEEGPEGDARITQWRGARERSVFIANLLKTDFFDY
jgi:hypothetical protein